MPIEDRFLKEDEEDWAERFWQRLQVAAAWVAFVAACAVIALMLAQALGYSLQSGKEGEENASFLERLFGPMAEEKTDPMPVKPRAEPPGERNLAFWPESREAQSGAARHGCSVDDQSLEKFLACARRRKEEPR